MSVDVTLGKDSFLLATPLAGFVRMRQILATLLLDSEVIHPEKWQQLDVSQSPAHATHELRNVTLWLTDIPASYIIGKDLVPADQPWAEDHFQERVGGKPVNPGATHHYWPYHGASAQLHLREGDGKKAIYDHNYMERFWPKYAGEGWRLEQGWVPKDSALEWDDIPMGYRFPIGDLEDVVQLLIREPSTRQAFLPVWFPEDTGSTKGQRVPCTLGYHFLARAGKLSMTYYLRSCEVYRHFTNDVYLAARLLQWVAARTQMVPAQLTMQISSFHGFVGDADKIKALAR